MNRLFISRQLYGLDIQQTDRQEIHYWVREIHNVGEAEISEKIMSYCKKINILLYELGETPHPYWGFVYEYLRIFPKEKAIIYAPDGSTFLLKKENFDLFTTATFFFIIGEKESTIEATMSELIKREKIFTRLLKEKFTYYGLVLGGTCTTDVIRLIIELSKKYNFHIFVEHDWDLKGLEIFLDIKRWFPTTTSLGINPLFLNFININFEDGCEIDNSKIDFKRNTKTGIENILSEMEFLAYEKRKIYSTWVDKVMEERFELNSLTSLRLDEDQFRSKARDFVDYLFHLCKDERWNISSFGTIKYTEPVLYSPTVERPNEIDSLQQIKYDAINENEESVEDVYTTISQLEEIKELEAQINVLEDEIEDINDQCSASIQRFNDNAHDTFDECLKNEDISEDLQYSKGWKDLIINDYNTEKDILEQILIRLSKNLKNRQRKLIKIIQNIKGLEPLKHPRRIIHQKQLTLDNKRKLYEKFLLHLTNEANDRLQVKIEERPEYNNLQLKYNDIKKELKENLEIL